MDFTGTHEIVVMNTQTRITIWSKTVNSHMGIKPTTLSTDRLNHFTTNAKMRLYLIIFNSYIGNWHEISRDNHRRYLLDLFTDTWQTNLSINSLFPSVGVDLECLVVGNWE